MKLKVDVVKQDILIDRGENRFYLVNCAALSFHKSLIGISELKALESSNSYAPYTGGLRISRAMSAYYSVYHLFVSMILLDEEYDLKVKTNKKEKKEIVDGYLDIRVSTSDLNNELETPEAWNNASKLEQDIATRITHTQVKDYCVYLRKKIQGEILNPPFGVLYEYFVKVLEDPKTSVKGLYEKICYIRDRVLYRPSYVIGEESNFIHTSAYIKSEIDNLPRADELYNVVVETYKQMLYSVGDSKIFREFFRCLWMERINELEENVRVLGYTNEDIEKYRTKFISLEEHLSFSTYITHLMEIVDRERLSHDYDMFWEPLLKITP
ncbi:hypothetical protein [Bacillus suaedaesalsae]|uniref:Uncharacterized protein n=1 Tax=Bacillus suaedaesalsae TaxID=2810349 RepID=A0ABS2DFQ0_9BACI|nr:hypothetical protein [Bacillus suaedaesalsae]MBM6617297.1 hypothetical protein [Bacillus suaedaesalsae]